MTVYCPHEHCGREMWRYDERLYTCRRGHKMAADAVQPATPRVEQSTHIIVPRPRWWQHPAIPWGVAGVLALAQVLEVVL